MSHNTALLDANVLYPAPMRDVLMQLAVTDIFKAKWSEDIHQEWIDALMRNEPHRDRAALERTR
ncbi:MAG: PIN domain-containing protein, partial [Pseudomonadota bacterium]